MGWRFEREAHLLHPPDLKGPKIMVAFEAFLVDHPQMAGQPYGAAMAATLSRAFPCAGQ